MNHKVDPDKSMYCLQEQFVGLLSLIWTFTLWCTPLKKSDVHVSYKAQVAEKQKCIPKMKHYTFNITGPALSWFKSYLLDKCHYINIYNCKS